MTIHYQKDMTPSKEKKTYKKHLEWEELACHISKETKYLTRYYQD